NNTKKTKKVQTEIKPQKKKNQSSFDFVLDSLRESYHFIRKQFKPLFVSLLKVQIWVLLLVLVGLALSFGTGFLFWGMSVPLALFAGGLLFLITLLVSSAGNSVMYNVIQNIHTGKETPIVENTKKNFIPVTKYSLLIFFAYVLVLLPLVLMIVYPIISSNPESGAASFAPIMGGILFAILWIFLVMLFLIAAAFLIQFAMWELILNRRGVIESIKESFRKVKGNFWKVVIFNIAIIAVSMIIQVFVQILTTFLQIFITVLAVSGNIVVILLAVIVFIALMFVLEVLTQAVIMPAVYKFWKKL
ncbi:DUF4013 domain-containing protein, partial [Candidatus Micrarchaeota archaeon]|nr:DUF4013 domain-containing protein [Candidatus Micrarchaeota archaeon]